MFQHSVTFQQLITKMTYNRNESPKEKWRHFDLKS